MSPLDLTKPVQTRDGRPARIICTDRKGGKPDFCVVALVMGHDREKESLACFTTNGKTNPFDTTIHDLINAPVKREGWVNIYPLMEDGRRATGVFHTKEGAGVFADPDRVACVRVEWEEPV